MLTDQLVDLSNPANTSDSLREHLTNVGKDPNPTSANYQPNYVLSLEGGDTVTHNRFIVPEWGTLRFDLHAPDGLHAGNLSDTLRVFIKGSEPGDNWEPLGEIDLRLAEDPGSSNSPFIVGYYDYANGEYIDPYTYSIAYGTRGFETFHLQVPEDLNLGGKSATLGFELTQGSPDIYLDDVFFQSTHLKLGNPSDARYSANPDIYNQPDQRDNYLIEKPQYSLSYNDDIKGLNWVSWQLNRSWLGTLQQVDLELNDPNAYPPAGFTPPFSPNFPDAVGIPDASYPPDYLLDYPWVPDDTLPGEWVRTQGPDYRLNNIIPQFRVQRGHMTPFADRSRTFKDGYSTFLTTNVIPQNGGFNQGVWETLENQSRTIVNNVNAPRELYIIAGGFGYDPERPIGSPASNPPGEIRNFVRTDAQGRVVLGETTNDPNSVWTTNPKHIGIPAYSWKIIVPLRPGQGVADITANTQVTAVVMNNLQRPEPGTYQLPNGTVLTVNNPNDWMEWRGEHPSFLSEG